MTAAQVAATDPVAATEEALAALAAAGPSALERLPEGVRQELMRVAVTAYSAAWQQHRQPALASGEAITATDAVIAATGLLRAVNVELFELAMWQTQAGA